MFYTDMAYVVMACAVMACSYGLYRYGLYSRGLYRYGLRAFYESGLQLHDGRTFDTEDGGGTLAGDFARHLLSTPHGHHESHGGCIYSDTLAMA